MMEKRPSHKHSKKTFIFICIFISLIFYTNFASAAEFDNVKSYNEDLKVVTITNALGIGEVIGQARLVSPLNVKVAAGYQKVAEFDIWAYQDYSDALKQFSFVDMKNKKKINRDYDLKYFNGMRNITENIYNCTKYITNDNGIEDCVENEVVGTRIIQKEDWVKITPADLKKNDFLRVGVFTDVQVGDHIDWIPVIYGVEVEEWAEWTQSLNVELVSYYKFDEESGTNAIDSVNNNNGTINGATVNVSGKIGTSYSYDGVNDYVDIGLPFSTDATDSFTISGWFKTGNTDGNVRQIITDDTTAANPDFVVAIYQKKAFFSITDSSGANILQPSGFVDDDSWHHFVAIKNSNNNMTLYIDGQNNGTISFGGDGDAGRDDDWFIGARRSTGTEAWDGEIDEIGIWNRTLTSSEVAQLWNSGSGISWTDIFGTSPEVTLISPSDNSNFTEPTITFTANVTDDQKVDNVTLYLDGVANETNSSGYNGTYTFSKTVSLGYHNWSILAWNNQSLSNQSETRFFNYTDQAPQVILTSPANNSNLTYHNVNLVASVTDNIGVKNVTLYLDGVANETNSSGYNGTYTFSKRITEGLHNWSILAYDNVDLSNQSGIRFFNYTQPPIFITLNNPVDNYNSSNATVNMSCTGYSATGVTELNLTIDGLLNETLTNSTSQENLTIIKNVNYDEGVHTWNCSTRNNGIVVDSATRTLTIDQSEPVINITFPLNNTYNFNSSNLNYTISDLTSTLCWYSTDEGVTNSTPVTGGTNFTNIVASEGLNTWTVYCNDTVNNVGSDSVTFDRKSLTVTLNSPTNGSKVAAISVPFNVTLDSSIGEILKNTTLYTNLTGSWTATKSQNVVIFNNGSEDTTHDPDSANLPEYAFDGNDSSFAGKSYSTGSPTSASLGKIFDSRYVETFYHKSRITFFGGGASSGNVIFNIQTYDGATWTTVNSTSYSFSWGGGGGSIDRTLEFSLLINDTIEGLRVNGQITGLSVSGNHNYNWYEMNYNDSSASESTQIINQNINNDIIWNAELCTTNNNCTFADNNFTLLIDNEAPQVIVEAPNETFDYNYVGGNETLNVTFIDDNLDSCWYNYNGTNITISGCVNGTKNSTKFILEAGKLNMTVYANDTASNINSSFISWNYKVFEEAQTFNPLTTEGAVEVFSINFSKPSSLQVSAINLIYNGTSYSIPYVVVGDDVFAEGSITIPPVNTNTNLTFFWNMTLSDGSIVSTRTNEQNISTINIDNCDSYTNLIYNFTQYDEEDKSILNTSNNTIEIQLNLWDTEKTSVLINFSKKYENINPAQICLEDSILETVEYSSYVVVKYFANITSNNESYAVEYYNILNESITNSSVPKNIALYDVKDEDSTPFRLTFRDDAYVLAPNILVQVWRQYIEDNDFKIVEIPLTDSNGQTMLNLVRNNVVYNFIMVNESRDVVGIFNNVKAFCQDFTIGDCTINLAPDPSTEGIYNYEEEFDISISDPSYDNSTKIISTTFLTGDLEPSTVKTEIIRNNPFGNRSVCSDTLTSSSGILSCNVSEVTDTDQFLFISTFVNGELARSETINLNATTLTFGILNGAFFAWFLVLILICIFMEDKRVLLVSIGLGWVSVISLGLINGKLIGASAAGVWLIISISVMIWKLSKEDRI